MNKTKEVDKSKDSFDHCTALCMSCFFVSFSFIEKDRVAGYWTFMFVMSKVPELGDTIFIVLRKQPLIFLHW